MLRFDTVDSPSIKNHILPFAGADKLSKPVAAQKWDRVKLVCTQPFNKVNNLLLSLCIIDQN